MDRTERVELTTMILIEDVNRDMVLLQNRVKKDYQGYTLPGGHLELGESVVDCAKREVKEETGLTILDGDIQMCGIKQFPIEGGRYIVFLFKAIYMGIEEPKGSSEGTVEWFNKNEIYKLKTVDDLKLVFDTINSQYINEFVKNDNDWRLK